MKDRRIRTFAKSEAGLHAHACAFSALSGDEVIVAAATPGALGRVCETMGFRDMDLGRAKRVAISELGGQKKATASLIDRVNAAHRNAIESAAHPTSKPHREAAKAFQRHTDTLKAILTQLEQEVARWTPVAERMPDDNTLVLLALNDDEAWPGYRDGDTWRYVDAMPIANERVTHWMRMPVVPPRSAA